MASREAQDVLDDVNEKLETALGALADIAFSDDMAEAARRAKAKRVYEELRADLKVEADPPPALPPFTLDQLRNELASDLAKLGYLPLVGEVEYWKHTAKPEGDGTMRSSQPVKAKKIGKLVGNDVHNAALLNA